MAYSDCSKLVGKTRLIKDNSDKVVANVELLVRALGVRGQGRHHGCHMEHNWREVTETADWV